MSRHASAIQSSTAPFRSSRSGAGPPRVELERLRGEIERLSAFAEDVASELQTLLVNGRDERGIEKLRSQRREVAARIARLQERLPELERARRRAEQAERIPEAESLTRRAREADRCRLEALRQLHRGVLHAFAKLAAFERAEREVEEARERAEEAWRQAGLDVHAATQRVDVGREPPFELLGETAHLWMSSCLRNLRAARADFVAWWKL